MEGGAADRGKWREGAADRGNWWEGTADRGKWREGAADRGKWREGTADRGKWREGAADRGKWREGTADRGNWREGAADREMWREGAADRGSGSCEGTELYSNTGREKEDERTSPFCLASLRAPARPSLMVGSSCRTAFTSVLMSAGRVVSCVTVCQPVLSSSSIDTSDWSMGSRS